MDSYLSFSQEHLSQGLKQLCIPYSHVQLELCEQFYKKYSDSMKLLNISTIHTPKDFIEKHILDSLVAYPYLKSCHSIADLGSGGGFPGIILGIFLPNVQITLIDVVEKKVQYLKTVIQQLKLSHISVYNASQTKVPSTFDIIVSRAVGSLSKVILYSKPYLKAQTQILVYKGKKETVENEKKEIKKNISLQIIPVDVPFLDAERHLVLLKSIKS